MVPGTADWIGLYFLAAAATGSLYDSISVFCSNIKHGVNEYGSQLAQHEYKIVSHSGLNNRDGENKKKTEASDMHETQTRIQSCFGEHCAQKTDLTTITHATVSITYLIGHL